MKAFTRALIVLSLSIICILNIGLVSAVEQGEISVVPSWSDSTPYQGDTVTVTLRLTSTSSEQLKIYRVGLHFDWMPEGSFFTLDLTDDPVTVPATGTHVFDLMVIQIPSDVIPGAHNYYIGIDGTESPYYDSFSWDSAGITLQILDAKSKVYDTLLEQVNSDISKAVNAGYQSADAKTLLAQAQTEKAQAETYAVAGNWAEAITTLQSAAAHLTQADAAEQLDAENRAGQQTLLLYVAIVVVVVVVALVIVVAVLKRRKKPDEFSDQPVEEQMETQDYTPEE